MSAIVYTSTAIEVALRSALARKGLAEIELRRPLSMMVGYGMKMELLRPNERNLLTELRHIRNSSIHEDRIPTREEVRWAIEITSRTTQELLEIV